MNIVIDTMPIASSWVESGHQLTMLSSVCSFGNRFCDSPLLTRSLDKHGKNLLCRNLIAKTTETISPTTSKTPMIMPAMLPDDSVDEL